MGTTLFALALVFVEVAVGGTGDAPGMSNKRAKRSRFEDAGVCGGKAFSVEGAGDMRSFKGTKELNINVNLSTRRDKMTAYHLETQCFGH